MAKYSQKELEKRTRHPEVKSNTSPQTTPNAVGIKTPARGSVCEADWAGEPVHKNSTQNEA
jgi:hypothetical protein